ncbi:MAG TPA: VWA domain-containing protein, partial [Candidatus Diapherotrites archaeon]|nr:VWA domain-containing protein [Candidatus Diapherotrites archaeon]
MKARTVLAILFILALVPFASSTLTPCLAVVDKPDGILLENCNYDSQSFGTGSLYTITFKLTNERVAKYDVGADYFLRFAGNSDVSYPTPNHDYTIDYRSKGADTYVQGNEKYHDSITLESLESTNVTLYQYVPGISNTNLPYKKYDMNFLVFIDGGASQTGGMVTSLTTGSSTAPLPTSVQTEPNASEVRLKFSASISLWGKTVLTGPENPCSDLTYSIYRDCNINPSDSTQIVCSSGNNALERGDSTNQSLRGITAYNIAIVKNDGDITIGTIMGPTTVTPSVYIGRGISGWSTSNYKTCFKGAPQFTGILAGSEYISVGTQIPTTLSLGGGGNKADQAPTLGASISLRAFVGDDRNDQGELNLYQYSSSICDPNTRINNVYNGSTISSELKFCINGTELQQKISEGRQSHINFEFFNGTSLPGSTVSKLDWVSGVFTHFKVLRILQPNDEHSFPWGQTYFVPESADGKIILKLRNIDPANGRTYLLKQIDGPDTVKILDQKRDTLNGANPEPSCASNSNPFEAYNPFIPPILARPLDLPDGFNAATCLQLLPGDYEFEGTLCSDWGDTGGGVYGCLDPNPIKETLKINVGAPPTPEPVFDSYCDIGINEGSGASLGPSACIGSKCTLNAGSNYTLNINTTNKEPSTIWSPTCDNNPPTGECNQEIGLYAALKKAGISAGITTAFNFGASSPVRNPQSVDENALVLGDNQPPGSSNYLMSSAFNAGTAGLYDLLVGTSGYGLPQVNTKAAIMIIIDHSGSMLKDFTGNDPAPGEEPKIEAADREAERIIEQLYNNFGSSKAATNLKIAIMNYKNDTTTGEFESRVTTCASQQLEPYDPDGCFMAVTNVSALKNLVHEQGVNAGGTRTGAAIDIANRMFERAIYRGGVTSEWKKIMIIITDGQSTTGSGSDATVANFIINPDGSYRLCDEGNTANTYQCLRETTNGVNNDSFETHFGNDTSTNPKGYVSDQVDKANAAPLNITTYGLGIGTGGGIDCDEIHSMTPDIACPLDSDKFSEEIDKIINSLSVDKFGDPCSKEIEIIEPAKSCMLGPSNVDVVVGGTQEFRAECSSEATFDPNKLVNCPTLNWSLSPPFQGTLYDLSPAENAKRNFKAENITQLLPFSEDVVAASTTPTFECRATVTIQRDRDSECIFTDPLMQISFYKDNCSDLQDPDNLELGTEYCAKVTMKNKGLQAWNDDGVTTPPDPLTGDHFRLGIASPRDSTEYLLSK